MIQKGIMIQKPLLSISEGVVPETESLSILRDYGFTHLHFSRKWRSSELVSMQEIEQLQRTLESAGLKVLDVHGPHPRSLDIAAEDSSDRQLAFDAVRHRLKITHALGGDAMVYHVPTSEFNGEVLFRYIDGLKRLEEEARELGIVIALENHYQSEVDKATLSACFEEFSPEYIGFTFDTGHACMSGNFDWILNNCMERFTVLHLNDNDGRRDLHWLPFQEGGAVDWSAVVKSIASSPYDKPVQLEVKWHEDKHASHEEFLRAAAASAQKLHRQITELRQNP